PRTAPGPSTPPPEERPPEERITRVGDKEVHWLIGSTSEPDTKGIFVTNLGGTSPSGDYERDVEARISDLIATMKPVEPGQYITEAFDKDKVRALRSVLKGTATLTVDGLIV